MAGQSIGSADAWAAGRLAVPLTVVMALLVRFAVGLHGYSGAGTPPLYGDYEAQRHWMEITVNTPLRTWYTETPDNPLQYWGLDYPPLTAYQSWLYGKVIQRFDPAAVELSSSRGYESARSKLLMRWSVVASDLLVFIPAVLACVRVFGRGRAPAARLWLLAAALLQPAAVIIDHGHFQYNNISLGFAAGAAAAIAAGRDCLGSALFCLALNHKQMAMYYAPAFFAHLLGRCLQRATPAARLAAVARLGTVVVATFALLWAPYMTSPGAALQVLQRLAPIRRGLYEDYVANFWCATSLLIKWKRLFSQQALVRMCAAATLCGILPSMVQQIRRPSPRGLLLAMANSAFAFYLFAYQVHEKSILLPLLPVTLLATEEPKLAAWLPALAAFSMFPLLKKDGLALAYGALVLLWVAVANAATADAAEAQYISTAGEVDGDGDRRSTDGGQRGASGAGKQKGGRRMEPGVGAGIVHGVGQAAPVQLVLRLLRAAQWWRHPWPSVAGALLIHAAALVVPAPTRYPFIHDAALTSYSFLHCAAAALYLNWRQWTQERTHSKQL